MRPVGNAPVVENITDSSAVNSCAARVVTTPGLAIDIVAIDELRYIASPG